MSHLSIFLFTLILSSRLYSQKSEPSEKISSIEKSGIPDQAIYHLSEKSYIYQKKNITDMLYGLPDDLVKIYDRSLAKENRFWLWSVFITTALGIYYDQDIIDEAQRLGKRWGLPQQDKTKVMINILGLPIGLPTDFSSSLYFIGDGLIHGGITLGFLSNGYFSKDLRAYQTSIELMQGLALTAFGTQALKHLTGRESPFTSKTRGGVWRFFPNQIDYHKNVPKYDAYPSGHMATTMMTTTVLAQNYPDHKYIWPLGSLAILGLGFGMLNNGVHWFGDYPLALALGYLSGSIVVESGRQEIKKDALGREKLESKNRKSFLPLISQDKSIVLQAWWEMP